MFGIQLSTQVTVGDVLTFLGLLGGFVGLVFVYLQVKASNRQTQLTADIAARQFLLDMINRYFDDPEMLRLYSLIDSGQFTYTPDTYIGSQNAAAVSRTLYFFDTVGFLVNKKLISLEEVAIFGYRIIAFFDNLEVQKVLQSLYSRTRSGGTSHEPHELARQVYYQLNEAEYAPLATI